MLTTNPAAKRTHFSNSAIIVLFTAIALLVHLLTNGRYGYFRDELYYIACARHLDFGYVDQPPFSILILRLSEFLLGDSLPAIRLLPALAGAATVALTGLIARELGGRGWAIALACAGSLCALFNLGVGNFFSMNAFEPLFWMGSVYLLVRIINGGSPTVWLWLGALLGFGLENKHSTVFFGVGIFIALLLTPERRHFMQKWIWFGGLIAFAIALPNIAWEARHHWPTYELLNNIAHSNKNVALGPADFIAQQINFLNPATLPLWLGGLVWLFGSRAGRIHRFARQKLLSCARISDALCSGRGCNRARFRRPPRMAEANFARHDPYGRSAVCTSDSPNLATRQTRWVHASNTL